MAGLTHPESSPLHTSLTALATLSVDWFQRDQDDTVTPCIDEILSRSRLSGPNRLGKFGVGQTPHRLQ